MSAELHIGDFGTMLEFTVKDQDGEVLDLSEATGISLVFSKPDATELLVEDLNLTTDGTDGKTHYTIEEDVLDISGTWRMQLIIEFSSGCWYSDITEMKVYPNL